MIFNALMLVHCFMDQYQISTIEQDKLAELRSLIKKLGDEDSKTRDASQDKIKKLIEEEVKAKSSPQQVANIKQLIKEIKQEINNTKDVEVKTRLDRVLEYLTESSWKKIEDFPFVERYGYTATPVGKKLVFWGGKDSGKDLYYNDGAIYDVEKNSWEKLKDSPIAERGYHTAALVDKKLVFWGGYTKSGSNIEYYNDGAIYDVEKSNWEKIKDAPIDGNGSYTAILVDKKIVFWNGGYHRNYGAIYDVEKNSWEKLKDSPKETWSYNTAILAGKKIVFWGMYHGGRGGPYNEGAIYDMEKSSWEKIKDVPIGRRSNYTAILVDKKLVFLGGRGGNEYYKDGAIFDIDKNSWKKINDASIKKRDNHTATLIGKKLVFWGGYAWSGSENEYYNDGAIYDIEKNSWEKIKDAPIMGRSKHTSTLVGKKLVIWGGETVDKSVDSSKYKYCNDGAIYDIEKNSWEKIKDAPIVGRYGHKVFLLENQLVFWGGCDNSGVKFYNDGAIFTLPIISD